MKKVVIAGLVFSLFLMVAERPFAAPKWEMKYGHDTPENSPHHNGALYLKKMVEEGSNGEISVKIFPNQLLGTNLHMQEMVQTGALKMLQTNTSSLQAFQQTFQLFDLPFLFLDTEILHRMLDGELGKKIAQPLEGKNMEVLTYFESGFKQFTSNFPIRTPQDLKGRKIRIMPNPVLREQFKALGAAPVPIDFGELYNALQQGVVDGQENPLTTIVMMKFYEVQKYITLSYHAFLGCPVIINKKFLDSLPDKYQKLIRESAGKAAVFERNLVQEGDKKNLELVKKAGMTVISLPPEAQRSFQKAVEPVYNWFKETNPEGRSYLDMVKAAQKK
jgi:C4-dicarboxylate-binding protein DctP